MAGLSAAFLGMVAALFADLLASRAGASRVASYATSFVLGVAVAVGLACLLPAKDQPAQTAIALLAFCAWWFIFLNFVQALESSLRVRLLSEIRAASAGLSIADLKRRYDDDALLRLRLDRLLDAGAVAQTGGRLRVVAPGLRVIAGVFRVLKKTMLGRTSEFTA